MNKEPEKTSGIRLAMPLLKVSLGVALIVLILKTTPIFEILSSFFTIVLIPVALLCAFGLVSAGTYNLLSDYTLGWIADLKTRTYSKLDEIRTEGDPNMGTVKP